MSAGTTAVAIVEALGPVAGTLGGVVLGFYGERWRSRDERHAAREQHDRDAAAALLAGQGAAVSAVMSTAVQWRRDISTAAVALAQGGNAVILLPTLVTSHAAFGEAVFAASTALPDPAVLGHLDQLRQLYEDGFDALPGLVDNGPSGRPDVGRLEAIASDLGGRLDDLQVTARQFFQGQAVRRRDSNRPA